MAHKRGLHFSMLRHYDRVLAVVVLAALLVSLLVLAQTAVDSRERKQRFERAIGKMRPAHPERTPLDASPYANAVLNLHSPQGVRSSTNESGLFVPQRRVACKDCRFPIPVTAQVCPFCNVKQGTNIVTNGDSEGRGIPDSWREKHWQHPDARAEDGSRWDDDPDGDRFTNLDEYKAAPQTNPRDSNDHPDLMGLLRFKQCDTVPFPFVLMSASVLSDGRTNLFFKTRGSGEAVFVTQGKEIGKTGLIYTNSYVQSETLFNPSLNRPMTVNRHTAQLFRPRDGKRFELRENDRNAVMERKVVLTLAGRERATDFAVENGGVLELDGEKYRVAVNLAVDFQVTSVVLENIRTGKKSTIEAGKP